MLHFHNFIAIVTYFLLLFVVGSCSSLADIREMSILKFLLELINFVSCTRAWQIAFEEARTILPPSGNPPPYNATVMYPGQQEVQHHYPIQVGGPSNIVYTSTYPRVGGGYPGQIIALPDGTQGK